MAVGVSSGCEVEECEQSHWFLGAAGVCNSTTNRCDCPAGYSGRFILNPSETCHISHVLKVVLASVGLAINVGALCLMLCFVVKVTLEINTLSSRASITPVCHDHDHKLKRREREGVRLIRGLTKTLRGGSMGAMTEERRRSTILRRKLSVLFVLSCFCMYLLFNIPRMIAVFADVDIFAQEFHGSWMLIYVTGDVGFVIGMSGFLYSFYKSLPNVAYLAKTAGINSLLAQNPSLIYYVMHVNSLALVVAFYVIGILYVSDTVPGFRENITSALTIFYALMSTDLYIVYCMIYYLTIRLFRQIIRTNQGRVPMSKVKVAVFRLNCTLVIGTGFVVYGILTVVLFLPPEHHKYHFIIFTGFSIGCMQICVILGYWLARDYVRIDRPRHTTTTKQNLQSESVTMVVSKSPFPKGHSRITQVTPAPVTYLPSAPVSEIR